MRHRSRVQQGLHRPPNANGQSRVVNPLDFKMTTLDGTYAVCRLDTRSGVQDSGVPHSSIFGSSARGESASEPGFPGWVRGGFWSITQTSDELSIVCPQECVPGGVLHEGGWRVLKVPGPLSFALTGIMASISSALADAGISIFALSTYDTDYILVKADQLENAIDALRRQGVEFE